MTSKSGKYFETGLGIYPVTVVVAHGDRQWDRFVRDYPDFDEVTERQDHAGAMTVFGPGEEGVMILGFWFPEEHRNEDQSRGAVMAHEAAHGAANVFELIAEEHHAGEPFAYLVGYLYQLIGDHIEGADK